MRKYKIQRLLDKYKNNGKKGKAYKEVYRKVVEAVGIEPSRFHKARNWNMEDSNTLTSNDLIKLAIALEVTVDELLNYPPELEIKRKAIAIAA
jgi:DNA-binding Xre family transcriptional regulator